MAKIITRNIIILSLVRLFTDAVGDILYFFLGTSPAQDVLLIKRQQ
ncbi:MAG TPA: hypothetical protein VIJ75_08030 [Hanamia sp.]